MSIPRALLLVLALLQASGIVEVVRRATCEAECERDGCERDCAPGGEAAGCRCHCPAAAPVIAAGAVAAHRPASREAPSQPRRAEELHPSPDPREIAHVPRSSSV